MGDYFDERDQLGYTALQAIMMSQGLVSCFYRHGSISSRNFCGIVLTSEQNIQTFNHLRTSGYRFEPNGCNQVDIYLRRLEDFWFATCGIYQLTLYGQKDQPRTCRTEMFRFKHGFSVLDQSLMVVEAHQYSEEIQTIGPYSFYPRDDFRGWLSEWEITDPLVQYLIEQKEPAIA